MAKIHFDISQGDADWYAIRSKIPTASEFHHILTPKTQKLSASRFKYACRIIASRILNWQADSLDKIQHIADGKALEPMAVGQLETVYDSDTRAVGFVTTNDGRFGASPDRIVMAGDAIGLTVECKCPTIPVQFERILFGNGEEYIAQVQGQLWVAEADKAIFYSFNPRMPPYSVETGRDEGFIGKLRDAMEQFSDELCALEERARAAGAYQAFAEILPPSEIETPDDMNAAGEIIRQGNWGG